MIRDLLLVLMVFTVSAAEPCWRVAAVKSTNVASQSPTLEPNILLGDFTGEKTNGVVVTRFGAAGISLFRGADGWRQHLIQSDPVDIRAIAALDIDQDGDLDLLAATQRNELSWWENPTSEPDADRPWRKHRVTMPAEANGMNAVLFADLLGTGRSQLVVSDERSVYLAAIPREPRTEEPWVFTRIFSANQKIPGLGAVDIDMDGALDLIAGHYWLKRKSPTEFLATAIGNEPGRIVAGRFRDGTFPQVLVLPLSPGAKTMLYDCKTKPENAFSWAGRQLLKEESAPISGAAAGDLDKNGGDDLILNFGGGSTILYADGRGDFRTVALESKVTTMKVGDLDNDGNLDIVGTGDSALWMWFNEPCK